MHNPRIAEWILKLVTAPDRAATAVGDLMEESEHRGTAWFWRHVVLTAASHVWSELRERPVWLLVLALSGVAEILVIGVVVANQVTKLWFGQTPDGYFIAPSGGSPLLLLLTAGVPMFGGWDVARRARGREIASGVALVAVSIRIAGIASVSGRAAGFRVEHFPYPSVEYRLGEYTPAVFAMAGAIVRRLRRGHGERPCSLVA
jgi:hypothetical protein